MKLNRTGSNWTELERNKINENWRIIEGNYNDVVDKVSEEAFDKVANSAKLNWKEPVDKYADLPSGASEGDTRMARDSGKVYRYNGEVWQEIQQIDAGPVNELDARLTTQLADIAVNIKEFGAVGDGVTDDSQAIKDAINSIDSGTIVFPFTQNGYLIKSAIYLQKKSDITVKGVGGLVKIKHGDNSDIYTFKNQDAKNITFENFEIDVNGDNQDASKYPEYVNTSFVLENIENLTMKNIFIKNSIRDLKLERCRNINVENVHVDGAKVDGWSIDNCDGGLFVNVSAKNIDNSEDQSVGGMDVNGFEIEDGSKNLTFIDVVTDNTLRGGITIKSHDGIAVCENINFRNVKITNSNLGINMNNGTNDIRFENITVSDCRTPIYATNVYDIKIKDIDLKGTYRGMNLQAISSLSVIGGKITNTTSSSEILYLGTQGEQKNIVFENVTIEGYGNSIKAEDSSHVRGLKFINCEISSIDNSPIWAIGEWDYLNFIDCNIYVLSRDGNRRIRLDNPTNVLFKNCLIDSNNRTLVISDHFMNVRIEDSVIISGEDMPESFIIYSRGNIASEHLSITNSVFKGGSDRHIYIGAGTTSPVKNLIISQCSFFNGVSMGWGVDQKFDYVSIVNNNFIDSTYSGDPTNATNLIKVGNNPSI